MDAIIEKVQQELLELQDLGYKEFHAKLMPTISPDVIIGVRTPVLRAYAKVFQKSGDCQHFMKALPHRFYEENNLQGFVIAAMKDEKTCLDELERFLPFVDNWATCDMMRPKVFRRNPQVLLPYIEKWLKSEKTYTVRFAIGMLMDYFLEAHFDEKYPKMVADIAMEEYYVQMMQAWYFATALAKRWDAIIPWLEEERMNQWVHNKTIRKAIESYRITDEQKAYLRTLARK